MNQLPQFQTIITKIEDNLVFQKEDEFIQTPHDSAVADCLASLVESGFAPGDLRVYVTNDYIVTTIAYLESEALDRRIAPVNFTVPGSK